MDALVVVIGSFVEKRPAARLALVLHLACVNQLVSPQRTRTLEALVAGFTAERRHVHRGPVQPVDHSALSPRSGASSEDRSASLRVTRSLVFL